MRGLLLVGISMMVASSLAGQTAHQAATRATRADGSVVLLYSDGTWKPETAVSRAKAPSGGYQKPATATANLELVKGASLAYDPTKWTLLPSDKPGRRQMNHRDGDGYALVIAERLQVPMTALKNIVLQNARTAAPDAKIIREEQRTVNGVPVTSLELTGTMQGIPFRYFGYYYAGKSGTIQVITYTGDALFPEYHRDFEELLNGFTAQ